jgi:hypothetical protein
MPPLTLVQKRALLAAMNNAQKAERAYVEVSDAYSNTRPSEQRALWNKLSMISRKWQAARQLVFELDRKLGLGLNTNYSAMELNVISNLLTKHLPSQKHKRWLKGLEEEKKRAMENFAKFSRNPWALSPSPSRRRPSPRRKTPSPPRPRGPSPRSPATLARQVNLGIMGGARHPIATANNTRVTWSRNANGKISIHKTLRNLNLTLTNAQKNALAQMSENKAMNTIRQLARRST